MSDQKSALLAHVKAMFYSGLGEAIRSGVSRQPGEKPKDALLRWASDLANVLIENAYEVGRAVGQQEVGK